MAMDLEEEVPPTEASPAEVFRTEVFRTEVFRTEGSLTDRRVSRAALATTAHSTMGLTMTTGLITTATLIIGSATMITSSIITIVSSLASISRPSDTRGGTLTTTIGTPIITRIRTTPTTDRLTIHSTGRTLLSPYRQRWRNGAIITGP